MFVNEGKCIQVFIINAIFCAKIEQTTSKINGFKDI